MTDLSSRLDPEALLAKAQRPMEASLRQHRYYRGKLQTALRCPVRSFDDFALWYSPGVAAPCQAIAADPEQVYNYTHKWNTVAIVSDGTRVLGLGDIGPRAALPVMEGKALLYKYLGGVDAWPLVLDTKDPHRFIQTILTLQSGFGGINLEDIAQPKCFQILDTLRQQAEIPVWHDDQQGTATAILAGLLNALTYVGKTLPEVSIAFVGAGAANIACARLIFAAGGNPENCYLVDSRGILHRQRQDIQRRKTEFVDKWRLCQGTNAEQRQGSIAAALQGTDVVIALSRPGPGTIHPDWVRGMAAGAIVFACANPIPEIWPWEATAAGAAIVATGRSDFPNQVNNSLVFPGVFRGALDVQATTLTDDLCLVAAQTLAHIAAQNGIRQDSILPTMGDWEIFPQVAAAVAAKAVEQGLARHPLTPAQAYQQADTIIRNARDLTQLMMDHGIIPAPEIHD
jgi:malate dehydrogenase (oxaloacetate-decarboxylating)